MAERIGSLEQVAEALERHGYSAVLGENSVSVKMGGSENPFAAAITIDPARGEMFFTCQVAKLGDFRESTLPLALLALLEANMSVCPFAFAVVADSAAPHANEAEAWPVVLTDSLEMEDLSEAEVLAEMQDLLKALVAGASALKAGLA
jgi:hypothetical protein